MNHDRWHWRLIISFLTTIAFLAFVIRVLPDAYKGFP